MASFPKVGTDSVLEHALGFSHSPDQGHIFLVLYFACLCVCVCVSDIENVWSAMFGFCPAV